MATGETDKPACAIWQPWYWSKEDTLDSRRQAIENNAAWDSYCGEG